MIVTPRGRDVGVLAGNSGIATYPSNIPDPEINIGGKHGTSSYVKRNLIEFLI